MLFFCMAFMGLGLLPIWTQCQLFSSSSMNYPNYAPSYYGSLPSPAAYIANNGGLGYGALLRSYMNQANQAPLDIQLLDSDPNVVLPKLPAKLDSSGQKLRAPYNLRALFDASELTYDTVGSPNFTKDRPKLYKGVYPSKFIDGQPYGSYTAFLKTLLSGKQPEASSSSLTPSYSQQVPSAIKSALGNDYSMFDKPAKQERAEYPSYSQYNEQEPKIIVTPVMYDPEKPPFLNSKDAPPYNINQRNEVPKSSETPQEGPSYYPDERNYVGPPEPRSRFRPDMGVRSFNPMRDFGRTASSYPNPFWEQYGPDFRSMYEPMMQNYSPGRIPTYPSERMPAYEIPYAMESRSYGQFNPYEHPNYVSIISRPGPAYATSFAVPPGPSGYEALGYDTEPSYEQPQYQRPPSPKGRNIATYIPGNRDRQEAAYSPANRERQEYVSYSPKSGNMDRSFEYQPDSFSPPIKYPRLGSAIDSDYKLQQVPSVIAALFGGKRLANSKPNNDHMQNNQDHYRTARKYGSENMQQSPKFSTPTIPNYSDVQKDERQDAKATTPTDIFLPVARAVKQSDPLKTIVFPMSPTSQVS